MSVSSLRLLGYSASIGGSVAILFNTIRRFSDTVEGTDPFSLHTAAQQREHRFSGMHDPFIPTQKQRDLFLEHFAQYSHLLPTSLEALRKQRALETSVKIQSLTSCPAKHNIKGGGTVVVGGPPALISSANQRNVTYINNWLGYRIGDGAAFHLEWDAESEAPTTYLPSQFMTKQLIRLLFNYESLNSAEKTGHYSWRTLDLAGWLKHPKHWSEGVRIALAFERATKAADRAAVLQEVALRCQANQVFYEKLNQDMDGQLLLPGRGSIIVARTEEEAESLKAMDEGLKKEGKSLRFLSRMDMFSRYGFMPDGVLFAEKSHDAALSPNFMKLIAKRLETLGGKVINGTLSTIYIDNPEEGGVIQYKTPSGKKKYIPFSDLVLSLGNQRILKDGEPLYDVISARGVSVLALVYTPKGRKLPPVMVCGGTNHVTLLSEAIPIEVNGIIYDVKLVRATAAACVTPTVSEEEAANYDGTAATGLVSAMRKTLDCPVEVLTVYGCNRQVNEFGQGHWGSIRKKEETTSPFSLEPRGHKLDRGTYRPSSERVLFTWGAGGGGLTNGPGQPAIKA